MPETITLASRCETSTHTRLTLTAQGDDTGVTVTFHGRTGTRQEAAKAARFIAQHYSRKPRRIRYAYAAVVGLCVCVDGVPAGPVSEYRYIWRA